MAQALEDTVFQTLERSVQDEILFEPSPRRVRNMFAGVTVADSRNVRLMLERRRLPVYYFPVDDVRTDLLIETVHKGEHPGKGEATFYSVQVGDRSADKVAWRYLSPERPDLKGFVAFYWDKMDAWFEEDDEVFVHPRDPYKRVDVLNSSRHVKVVLGGEVVADTRRPRLLFETGLPTRYYVPKLDVRLDLLTPTTTKTKCPYKGTAHYWTVRVGGKEYPDIVWGYPAPIPECPKIENLLSFFNEKVDIYVDEELQPRPVSPWS